MKLVNLCAALLTALLLSGCAGGWRNGPPPESVPAAAVPAAPAAATPAASAATTATADGARFVYHGEGSTVNLAGDFNSWSMTDEPMAKQADGSWVLEKKLAVGRYEYKFVVDGAWKADDGNPEKSDNHGNSVIQVGARAAAPTASPARPAAKTVGTGTAVTPDGVRFVYRGEGSAVNLAGDFNSWSMTDEPMAKQADGSWVLVKKLPVGQYEYKFVVDGAWKADDGNREKSDNYGNSVIRVGTGAAAATTPAPTPAAPKAGAGPGTAVTPDGVRFVYRGDGSAVVLAGDFNSWSMTAEPMAKQADGSWALVKKLEPGRHEYKFVVDGTWKGDDGNPEKSDNHGNSVINVSAAAAPAAASAPAATPAATTGKGARPAATPEGVTFTFAGAADQVTLAGDFNGWSTTTDPLTKQADGRWTITKKLAAGRYGYRFLVNGSTWKLDEANPDTQDDGIGGKNSVVSVH
jgi:1,4-alpha-glucan branching enzyme